MESVGRKSDRLGRTSGWKGCGFQNERVEVNGEP